MCKNNPCTVRSLCPAGWAGGSMYSEVPYSGKPGPRLGGGLYREVQCIMGYGHMGASPPYEQALPFCNFVGGRLIFMLRNSKVSILL